MTIFVLVCLNLALGIFIYVGLTANQPAPKVDTSTFVQDEINLCRRLVERYRTSDGRFVVLLEERLHELKGGGCGFHPAMTPAILQQLEEQSSYSTRAAEIVRHMRKVR